MKLPQLSLRELFLLVVIAAMDCRWWVDRTRLREMMFRQFQKNFELRKEYGLLRLELKNHAP